MAKAVVALMYLVESMVRRDGRVGGFGATAARRVARCGVKRVQQKRKWSTDSETWQAGQLGESTAQMLCKNSVAK